MSNFYTFTPIEKVSEVSESQEQKSDSISQELANRETLQKDKKVK